MWNGIIPSSHYNAHSSCRRQWLACRHRNCGHCVQAEAYKMLSDASERLEQQAKEAPTSKVGF